MVNKKIKAAIVWGNHGEISHTLTWQDIVAIADALDIMEPDSPRDVQRAQFLASLFRGLVDL